jgi:hypothetical protein
MLVDVIAFALPFPMQVKLELLSEPIVETRAGLLISKLTETSRRPSDARRVFPPDFSMN